MNDVQFRIHCTLYQALLLPAILTLISARPTSLQPTPVRMPDKSQLTLPGNLSGGVEFPDPDQKPLENPNLFEGDLLISSDEIELYYGKQSETATHVLI